MSKERCRTWAAVAAAAGVCGFGCWAAAAAEPTQQELVDQVRALQAKVEQLEAAQRGPAPSAQPQTQQAGTAFQDATVGSVLHDADLRSNPQFLEAGDFTAGYSKGRFTIQDAKGDFVLRPQFQFKPRWVANLRENVGGGDDQTQTGFEIRRMKFGFDGNVFGPDLTYFFLWATDRNSGTPVLEEAWAKWTFLKDWSIKGGQIKGPFAHESLTSSKKLLASERTVITDVFTGGENFVQGVSLGWDDGPNGLPLRWEIAYTDGANAPNTDGIKNNSNQNFQDFPTNKANFGADGRIEYLAFGKWSQYEDFTALGNKQDLLVFGAGVDFTEAGNNDVLLHTVDVQFETRRLGLYGAYLGRSIKDARIGTGAAAHDQNGYDWGFIAQAAYLLDEHLEPFVRYDYINFDKDLLATSVQENIVHEITAGVNYYYRSHNAKVTVDVTWLPNGTPVADSGADILASDGENEFVVRAQFQLLL